MNKQLTLRKSAVVGFSAMALSMFAFSAQALPLVTNGSFETVVGTAPAEITNTNLTGWSITGSFLACVTQTAATDACGAGGSAGAKLWISTETSNL